MVCLDRQFGQGQSLLDRLTLQSDPVRFGVGDETPRTRVGVADPSLEARQRGVEERSWGSPRPRTSLGLDRLGVARSTRRRYVGPLC